MQSKAKQRKRTEASPGKSNSHTSHNRKLIDKQESNNKSSLPAEEKEPVVNAKIDFKRIGIRCLVIIAIISVIGLTHKSPLETFVSQHEEVDKKVSTVQCSAEYAKYFKRFPECVTKMCSRIVSDTAVSLSEVQALLVIAQKIPRMGASESGVSIVDLHAGTLSTGAKMMDLYATSPKIITKEEFKVYRHIIHKVKTSVANYFGVSSKHFYLTQPTFISLVNSSPSQKLYSEYWHALLRQGTNQPLHYTAVLYLTDYNYHFKGGRFVYFGQSSNQTIEPRVGRLSAFTSGSENSHYVEPVSSGTRLAVTLSFTCDSKESLQDPKVFKL